MPHPVLPPGTPGVLGLMLPYTNPEKENELIR
jgi:hypothetical protein